ncbi:hypothetical protein SERLA73DRAFT_184145 [Serpula lacrymans var. lacrymans S7.3]|uniref:Uncharacterized protein n=2 Tax=Serpula lacrymans var. lacrymans TaxID=341189 RepID=F8Q2M7_SERL3|nr:uncharacterized protein SERLADRAFT_471674 [Serpula lacrymans var. lacrymans S7.9]EGN97438.1 hypothetical protein SERLA73DRAFT_184145 [Serpula lacrymans var. lacrymans S7.3]EGO23030.1 hypothetical protein SERLADRAFT_471674 [Serpula lacrymans var. lacrymans S7.9]
MTQGDRSSVKLVKGFEGYHGLNVRMPSLHPWHQNVGRRKASIGMDVPLFGPRVMGGCGSDLRTLGSRNPEKPGSWEVGKPECVSGARQK